MNAAGRIAEKFEDFERASELAFEQINYNFYPQQQTYPETLFMK